MKNHRRNNVILRFFIVKINGVNNLAEILLCRQRTRIEERWRERALSLQRCAKRPATVCGVSEQGYMSLAPEIHKI